MVLALQASPTQYACVKAEPRVMRRKATVLDSPWLEPWLQLLSELICNHV